MIRHATIEDATCLFEWRNSEEYVCLSTSQKPVGWNEHLDWLEAALASEQTLLYIIEPDAGTVRIDRAGSCGVISITVDPAFRGKGVGVGAIWEATQAALRAWPVHRVVAYVREENTRAKKAFQKAGFSLFADGPRGHKAFVYP